MINKRIGKSATCLLMGIVIALVVFCGAFLSSPLKASGATNVAKIGSAQYTSLKAAVDASVQGDTIELIADTEEADMISVNKDVTIVGGDHSVTLTNSSYCVMVRSGITLTIKSGEFVATNSSSAAVFVLANNAKLVIEGGGFESKKKSSIVFDDKDSAGVIILGGKFVSFQSSLYLVSEKSVVSGGEFYHPEVHSNERLYAILMTGNCGKITGSPSINGVVYVNAANKADFSGYTGQPISFELGNSINDRDIIAKNLDISKAGTKSWYFAIEQEGTDIKIYKSFPFGFANLDSPKILKVLKDEKVVKPEDPTKEGFTFAGWYKDQELTELFNFETETVSQATTIYAKWTVNAGGGEIGGGGAVDKDPSNVGVIIAIIGGIVLLIILVYLALYIFMYRKGKLDNSPIKAIFAFLPKGTKEDENNK